VPLARGYAERSSGLVDAATIDMTRPIGGGDMVSSVDDLAAWVRGLHAGRGVSTGVRETLFSPEPIPAERARSLGGVCGLDLTGDESGYAGGWFVGTQHGRRCVQHGGAIHGFCAYLAHFPDDDLTVVVLANAEIFELVLKTGVDLGGIALGETVALPAARTAVVLDGGALEACVGTYRVLPGIDLAVTRSGDQLICQATGRPPRPIFPESPTRFFYRSNDRQVLAFEPADDGTIREVVVERSDGRRLRGRRVEPRQDEDRDG
jgi:hypothetical protein